MGQIALSNPVLVARSGKTSVIASGGGARLTPMADAQLWSPENGYSEVQLLGVHLKWLHYVEEVNPPQPWQEPK